MVTALLGIGWSRPAPLIELAGQACRQVPAPRFVAQGRHHRRCGIDGMAGHPRGQLPQFETAVACKDVWAFCRTSPSHVVALERRFLCGMRHCCGDLMKLFQEMLGGRLRPWFWHPMALRASAHIDGVNRLRDSQGESHAPVQ